ncbi:MAG: pseudomurein-binding repeat-containing protein, partial [Methanothermobacter sp.]
GTLSKTEYIDVAKTINSYISSNDKAPGYVSTSLGKMGYETMVYSYAKILNFYKSYDRLPNTVSVTEWGTTETSQTSESSSTTVDQILKTAAKFGYSSLAHDAEGLVKYGSGDCWAMSDYLFKKFQAAGIKAKIVQYATAYASNHRSVMIYQNGCWVDVPYRTYGFNSMFNNISGSQYGTVIAIC